MSKLNSYSFKIKMMKRKFFIIIIFAIVSLSVSAINPRDKADKKRGDEDNISVEDTASYNDGIVYALPRTVLRVKVKAEKSIYIPGPYHEYASKYLGYDNVEQSKKVIWKIKCIDVVPIGEADPNAYFKTKDTLSSLVTLLPDGRIAGINSLENNSEALIYETQNLVNDNLPSLIFPDQASSDNYEIHLDSITGAEKFVVKSVEQKAQEAADYIIRLRKKRAYSILDPTDVVPEDGLGYQVFVEEAKRLEKEYITLFLGKTFNKTHEFVFNYIPDSKNVKNEMLFRFSEERGVLPKSDISGKPITIELSKEQKAYSSIDKLKETDNPNPASYGLYYRVPVMAQLDILNGIQPLYSARFPIAQYGVIAPLPDDLVNGKNSILFDTATGTIKSILKY